MKKTQIIVNRQPKEIFKSLTDAKKEGKRLLREFKYQNLVFGIDIQYKTL
jgi:hypothetical protein